MPHLDWKANVLDRSSIADPQLKVVVFHGSGGNFCAGFDLEEISMMGVDFSVEDSQIPFLGISDFQLTKPSIAAIDGYAVAGGLELSLFCDLRVVEETAILGVFSRRFGIPLIDGGTIRLPAIVGLGRALDLILTGRGISGKEALNIGLANYCVATGTSLGRAVAVAETIAKFPQQCVKVDRQSTYNSVFSSSSLQEKFDFELKNSLPVVKAEGIDGATKFVKEGLGRHAKFNLRSFESLMQKNKRSTGFPLTRHPIQERTAEPHS